MFSVSAGHPRLGPVPLHASYRRGVRRHAAGQRAFAGRRQSVRLDARALDVAQEGSDARLRQGDVTRRRRAGHDDGPAAVAAGRRARYDCSPTSERSGAAAWPVRRVAAAEEQQRRHQCTCVSTSAQRSTVRQNTRQSKRYQVQHRHYSHLCSP